MAGELEFADGVEVVAFGSRLLLCVGDETHELSGPDAVSVARLIDLLADGSSPDAATTILGVTPQWTSAQVEKLADVGCFRVRSRAAPTGDHDAMPSVVGIVGVDSTSLVLGRLLRSAGSEVGYADWRPWSRRESTRVPGTDASVGKSRGELLASDAAGPGTTNSHFASLAPWSDEFGGWLEGKSLVIVSTGALSPATHETVNARCGERAVPWTSIRHGTGYTEIGPGVRPPLTPCYVCLALRVALNRSAAHPAGEATTSPVRPDDSSREAATHLAFAEIREFVHQRSPGPASHLLRLDWSTREVTRLPVLKLPNCPGCEWWSVG